MDKLILIDGNSLVNRAFFATPAFSTKEGFPTNGILGFIKLYINILTKRKPQYAVVAFDMHAPTFRHKMYQEYKGTRKGMPEELRVQMPVLKECLALMGVKCVEAEGWEADDIIGTLSRKFENVESYIYTGDRDSYQLVNDTVTVCYTLKGVSEILELTNKNFFSEIGLTPQQIVEIKSLEGDKSDNIPGVPGIGGVTAKNLLSLYGSIDGIYEHIDQIKGATKKKLQEGKDSAYLSHDLATIRTNAPVDVALEECKIKFPFSSVVKQKFASLEFRTLYSNNDLFEQEQTQILATGNYNISIENIEAKVLLEKLPQEGIIGVVWEDSRKQIAFGDRQYNLTCANDLFSIGNSYADEITLLNRLFSNEKYTVVLFTAKPVLQILLTNSLQKKAKIEDISILRYLVDYSGKEEELNFVLDVYGYNKDQAAYSLIKLSSYLHQKLTDGGMDKLYQEIELPLIDVLLDMENCGVQIDVGLLDKLSVEFDREAKVILQKIYEETGETEKTLNVNSPSQLGKVLFDKMGLPSGKKGKSGNYTLNQEVLEKLATNFPICADILSYRQVQKLQSTYVEGLKPFIHEGRVHTTYNQTITSTGRLSSKNPNLQNIPVRTQMGKELRKLFIAKEGCVLIDADYSQIELRLIAHLSNCRSLIEGYKQGKDIHRQTAATVFGVPYEEVTDEMRRRAKTVNFGIIYGESGYSLAKTLGISNAEGVQFIDKYFSSYPEIKTYLDKTVESAKQNGFVTTLFGRKREFPELRSPVFSVRSFGERAAMNMPLQGTSADLIKIAMLSVHDRLNKEGLKAKLILQIHDELVLECPKEEVDKASKILKECMENAYNFSVPIIAEVTSGRSWYDAK